MDWNLAGQHFPEATQIVDLYHAREHLHDLAKLLEFMLGSNKEDWLHARLAELDAGNIDAIRAAARVFPLAGKKASDLRTALGYFEHNTHRMQYAGFRKLGMFVGSGAVEAGCKAIGGQRCKLSGMRWTLAGAYGILTLRCLDASDRWEQAWTEPARARHRRRSPRPSTKPPPWPSTGQSSSGSARWRWAIRAACWPWPQAVGTTGGSVTGASAT